MKITFDYSDYFSEKEFEFYDGEFSYDISTRFIPENCNVINLTITIEELQKMLNRYFEYTK